MHEIPSGALELSYEIIDAGPVSLYASAVINASDVIAGETAMALSFVEKAVLTAKANDAIRRQEEANPEFTISYSGFVYDDDINDLDQLPLTTVFVDWLEGEGEYPIRVIGGTDNNYTFDKVDGVLTIIGPTTGLRAGQQELSVFPIPVRGQVFLELPSGNDPLQTYTCRIFDMAGRLLISEAFEGSRHQLDFHHYPAGIYLLQLEDENGVVLAKRKLKAE